MDGNTDEALGVLRQVWSAQGQTGEDFEEGCGTAKSCKRMPRSLLAQEVEAILPLTWPAVTYRPGPCDRSSKPATALNR